MCVYALPEGSSEDTGRRRSMHEQLPNWLPRPVKMSARWCLGRWRKGAAPHRLKMNFHAQPIPRFGSQDDERPPWSAGQLGYAL
ncbi:hypothetical protein MHYP_G00287640 [Metynnis hypsauchen]